MRSEVKFILDESSSLGMVRRAVNIIALEMGFDEVRLGKIAIVVSELGTNILKHALRGEIIVTSNNDSISLVALDKGPGISNVAESLKDGYSTAGTAGNGLGAIKRLASHFDLFTQKDKGTVALATFNLDVAKNHTTKFVCNGFSLPVKGEIVSGDSWSYKADESQNMYQILIADGLGHGIFANEASMAAVAEFERFKHESPLVAVTNIHRCLKSTRGAAVAVAFCTPTTNMIEYCGLGNISGSIVSHKARRNLSSFNGTAGVVLRKTQSLPYPMDANSILIMHSDGLSTQWNLSNYLGLMLKDPLIIAAVLYRDFVRGNDDVTVVVAKDNT